MRGALGVAVTRCGSVSLSGLCWQGCPLLCFFFRDLLPCVQSLSDQSHHGVTAQAGCCSHGTVPERESRRTWISPVLIAQRSSIPVAPRALEAQGRVMLLQGAWGLVAHGLVLQGAGPRAWEQRERRCVPGSLPAWCLP